MRITFQVARIKVNLLGKSGVSLETMGGRDGTPLPESERLSAMR